MEPTRETDKVRSQLLSEHLGISGSCNPWGDPKIDEEHHWKKRKAEGRGLKSSQEVADETMKIICELENVKRRRENRLLEQEQLEDQRSLLARDKDKDKIRQWHMNSRLFQLQAKRERAISRLHQKRLKMLDFFVVGIEILENETYLPLQFPSTSIDKYLSCLPVETLDSLREEILDHLGPNVLPEDKKHQQLWRSVGFLVLEALKSALNPNRKSGVPQSVQTRVNQFLENKSLEEINKLEISVKAKLSKIGDGDPTFWETIESKIPTYQAVYICQDFINTVESKLKDLGKDETEGRDQAIQNVAQPQQCVWNSELDETSTTDLKSQNESRFENLVSLEIADLPKGAVLIDPEEDAKRREEQKNKSRKQFIDLINDLTPLDQETLQDILSMTSSVVHPKTTNADQVKNDRNFDAFIRGEKQDLTADDTVMTESNEYEIEQNPSWATKFQTRKPRYFNRVRTGFEWNKYNQTHYDYDNPPPRQVMGYKFNIYYPDLVNKKATPTWEIKQSDVPGTVILIFKAGPPYLDIAFQILNREWEINRNDGFRSCFDRDILQLYFNFKRYRYRR
eukprot:GHVP01013130.1.p1 GENE.GHVP01013130.1~~GHVP01013130.1.p1  ORF type:complete len:567 (+),score=98.15 GHVP01013130.1:312-2012(+)